MIPRSTWRHLLGAGCLAAITACSGGDDGDTAAAAAQGAGGGGALFAGDAGLERNFGDCVANVYAAEGIPLDLYVMFDQSGSMLTPSGSGTRLDVVRAAMTDFLHAKESSGLGVGIGYFGYLPIGKTSCDEKEYSTPAVGIGNLPDQASAVVASLTGISPVGETPTAAAIRGACSYAAGWATAHPDRKTVVLLMTDGVPEAPVSSQLPGGCNPTLADAVAATTECRTGTPNLLTYVIGVGPSLGNLDQIAKAGGTEHAYLVEKGDVETQVLSALNAIRGAAQIPCSLKIPPAPEGQTLDLARVNLGFVDGTDARHDFYHVPDGASCADADAWHYDDTQTPTTIELCPNACARVEGDVSGRLEIALGCGTLEITR